MAHRTHNAVKWQTVAVESALFSPDVVFLLAALLDARDLCQVSLTCKALGGKRKQAAVDVYNGLSLIEESARRQFECASEWERSCLKKYDGEGWIELYHHLLMLRSKLTFDQLVGSNIQYGEDQSIVQTIPGRWRWSSALCSNHVMRSGRHFAAFTITGGGGNSYADIGVIRPVQINRSDFDDGELDEFSPGLSRFWRCLRAKSTDRWSDSIVHCCAVDRRGSICCCYDWTSQRPKRMIDEPISPTGLLLDLDEGALSLYQNGQRLATLKDRLSGEYCWYAEFFGDCPISIELGSAPGDR